jgi:hypothetical protein
VTAALPDLPDAHPTRHRRVGAVGIMRAAAGLVAVLIGTAALALREKLASFVSRGDGSEQRAPDAVER